jgi:hypothetical protein
VWRELGEIRLLHLLENKVLILSMIGLLRYPQEIGRGVGREGRGSSSSSSGGGGGNDSRDRSSKTMLLVSKAILGAFSCLRAEEDKDWMIVSVGLYHIAASIFSADSTAASPTITSPQHRALTNMLSDCSTADWVVCSVLQAADCFFSNEASTDRTVHAQCEEGGDNSEGQGSGRVQGLTGIRERIDQYHEDRIRAPTPLGELALLRAQLRAPPVSVASVPVPALSSTSVSLAVVELDKGVIDSAEQRVHGAEGTLKDLLLLHRPHLL